MCEDFNPLPMPPRKRARVQDVGDDESVEYVEYRHTRTTRGLKFREHVITLPSDILMSAISNNLNTDQILPTLHEDREQNTMELRPDVDFTIPDVEHARRTLVSDLNWDKRP